MRITSLAATAVVLGALSIASVSPAVAAPGSGCPRGFTIASAEEVLGTDYTGVVDQVNHDGLVCIRFLNSGIGIFIDNTAP